MTITVNDLTNGLAPPPLSRRTMYVDSRRFAFGAVEVGLDLVALLVLDSIATRVEAAKAARDRHRNPPWGALARHLDLVRGWIDDGLTVERMHELLDQRGIALPERVLRQYAECYAQTRASVRVAVDVDLTEPPIDLDGELAAERGRHLSIVSDAEAVLSA